MLVKWFLLLAAVLSVVCLQNAGAKRLENVSLSELTSWVPSAQEILRYNGTSPECAQQTTQLLLNAEQLQPQALHMLDSWAKLPSGVLRGNINQLGDFDQCLSAGGCYCLATLDLQLPASLASLDTQIHAHYAMTATVHDPGHRLPKFSLVHWGMCVPTACSPLDLQRSVSHALTTGGLRTEVAVDEEMCHCPESSAQTTTFAWYIFGSIVCLCLVGTAVELKSKVDAQDTPGQDMLKAFSLRRNIRSLLDTDRPSHDIASLHGIRALNAVGLLLSHKQMALLFLPFVNRTPLAQLIGRPWSMVGRCAILYTDSFILLSGLLSCRSFLRELSRTNRINIVDSLLSRLIRLTPSLGALIVFCTLVLPGLGSGPLWGLLVTKYASLCQDYWWRNLLYIHNHFPFHQMCLTHSHQVGIDMQLFLAAPLLVYPLWRWPRRGILLLLVTAVWSSLLRYSTTLYHQLSTVVYFGVPISQLFRTAEKTYILPSHRATVYCIGITLGYFLHHHRTSTYGLSQVQVTLWWVVGVSCGLLAMFGPYHMAWTSYVYDAQEAALYNMLAPILWSIFLGWVIFACYYGYAGWFGRMLEWKWFAVFTRLSYAVYLTQFPIFFYSVAQVRTSQHYSFFTLLDLPEFAVVLLASAVLTVFVDLPAQNLKKLFRSFFQGTTRKCAEKTELQFNTEKTELQFNTEKTELLFNTETSISKTSKTQLLPRKRMPGL